MTNLAAWLAVAMVVAASSCSHDRGGPAAASSASADVVCRPQEFSKSVASCCGLPTFYFNGSSCADATMLGGKCGCSCSGPACDHLFDTLAACQAAYSRCPGMTGLPRDSGI